LLFEGTRPGAAMAASEDRVRGHRWAIASVLVAWGVVASILSAVPLALTQWLGEWILPRFSNSMHGTVWVVGGLLLFWGVVNLIFTLVNASMLALLVIRLYERLGIASDAELSGVDPPERIMAEGSGRRMSTAMVLGLLALTTILATAARPAVRPRTPSPRWRWRSSTAPTSSRSMYRRRRTGRWW
jgi:hypothetical protein